MGYTFLYPVGDYTEDLAGSLLSDFIYPYCNGRMRPVGMGDHFTIRAFSGDVALCILDIRPREYGLVTWEIQMLLAKEIKLIQDSCPVICVEILTKACCVKRQ